MAVSKKQPATLKTLLHIIEKVTGGREMDLMTSD